MDIDDLSEFMESKDIDIEDTLELASKLLSSLHCHMWCALFRSFTHCCHGNRCCWVWFGWT